jgi:TonB family protein
MIQQRKKSNSSKINLIISAVFHSALIACIFYFAAKEGLLGKKLKELTVTMEKVKKPEPPKEKPEQPKVEQPKQEAKASVPEPKAVPVTAPPPAVGGDPAVAPAATVLPSFSFNEGGREVQSISDPNELYKAQVEHTLRGYWNRPEDMADDSFVALVELAIDKSGYVSDTRWVSGSGNSRWDDSVKQALAQVKTINKPPPAGFPRKFTVRFDVESTKTEAIDFGAR